MKQKQPEINSSCSRLVRMTGLPPVAALADKQPFRLFGPTDKLLTQFPPYFKSRLKKQKQPEMNSSCFHLVRMTGLEPT